MGECHVPQPRFGLDRNRAFTAATGRDRPCIAANRGFVPRAAVTRFATLFRGCICHANWRPRFTLPAPRQTSPGPDNARQLCKSIRCACLSAWSQFDRRDCLCATRRNRRLLPRGRHGTRSAGRVLMGVATVSTRLGAGLARITEEVLSTRRPSDVLRCFRACQSGRFDQALGGNDHRGRLVAG